MLSECDAAECNNDACKFRDSEYIDMCPILASPKTQAKIQTNRTWEQKAAHTVIMKTVHRSPWWPGLHITFLECESTSSETESLPRANGESKTIWDGLDRMKLFEECRNENIKRKKKATKKRKLDDAKKALMAKYNLTAAVVGYQPKPHIPPLENDYEFYIIQGRTHIEDHSTYRPVDDPVKNIKKLKKHGPVITKKEQAKRETVRARERLAKKQDDQWFKMLEITEAF